MRCSIEISERGHVQRDGRVVTLDVVFLCEYLEPYLCPHSGPSHWIGSISIV
jgi:hypothetical protein